MEQFAGLFVIVAFVLWLLVFVPDRVRSKSRTRNSGYEDKFSTGVRILRDAQKQLKDQKKKKLQTRPSQNKTLHKPLAFYETTISRQKTVPNKPVVKEQERFQAYPNKKSTTKQPLPLNNILCIVSLIATIFSWLMVAFAKTSAIVAAIITLVYLIALFSSHFKKVVAMRGHAKWKTAQSPAQKNNRKVVGKPRTSMTRSLSQVHSKLEVAQNNEINIRTQYANAKNSFDRTKVLVGDFSPSKYTHNRSISSALQSQFDYANNLVSKFDDEIDAIDRAGKSYRLKASTKSSQ
ncbi:MAG: hypothetical protein LBI63_00770 [Candidatus Ancillula sp.]|nr:hypothetical protein [Candidatus Ancillula sp.]